MGDTLQISKAACFSILPLFFLISSVLSFVSQPATNYVSRIEERAADQYALDMTKDGKSGVKTFQYLSKTSLSQVNPPALVKFFLYTHPPIFERIHTFEQYEKGKEAVVYCFFFYALFEFWKIIVYNIWNIQ